MTNSAPAATETRVNIGRGTRVHRGNLDGNTYCGSQHRMGSRSAVSFLPGDTAVTCTKCSADTPAVHAPAPVPATRPACPAHRYVQPLDVDGKCTICDY